MSDKKPAPNRRSAAAARGGRSHRWSATPSATQLRIAEDIRDATEAAGLTRADLRRVLDIADWRTIQDRWTGAQPYSLEDLDTLGRLLGVTFEIPDPEGRNEP
jgi:hypothetical protein